MTKLVGLGAGGHAKVIVETHMLAGQFEIVGLLDPNKDLWNKRVGGVNVLGDDSLLSGLHMDGVRHAFIGVGSVGLPEARKAIFDRTLEAGFEIVETIHPRAVVSPTASWGCGLIIFAGAVINPDALLGKNVIVNTGAIVEHDCVIGDHVHVATGARLAGGVEVGPETHIGVGACIREGITIGARVIIAAGAVVVKDITEGVVAAGMPAQALRPSRG